MLFLGEHLGFGGDADWGGNYKDEVRNQCSSYGYNTSGIPGDFNITTMYERDANWNFTDLDNAINGGLNYINHLGHANNNAVMKVSYTAADTLTNTDYFLAYSQGCYAGSFDNVDSWGDDLNYDCVAEHLVTAPNGTFAVIMNSRYGWGAFDLNGPSQRLDREFFDALYGEMIQEIGKANHDSKEDSIHAIGGYGTLLRYCIYEANLLGDPAVRLKEPVKYEHDVVVKNIKTKNPVSFPESSMVNCTIWNDGLNNETNINVNLTINGITIKNTSIASLASDKTATVSFVWKPNTPGTYDVGIEITPVPSENDTTNNVRFVKVEVIAYPDIWMDRNEFNLSSMAGSVAEDNLIIGNSGPGNLHYNISIGSPDPGNYTLSQPTPGWLDGVTGGTQLSLSDDSYTTRTLPFMFDFYNNSYNEIHICSNGWASFVKKSNSIPSSIVFPTSGWPETLMVLGDDWNPNGTRGVYVKQLGSPNRYIITWNNIRHFDYGGKNNFQIVLYDDGKIDFNYQGLPGANGWEIALNKGDNIYATEYIDQLPENKTLRFIKESPALNWLTVMPDNGTVGSMNQTSVGIIANSSLLSPGFYSEKLNIISNDPDEACLEIPVNYTVLSAPHDIRVLNIDVPHQGEAGKPITINATILNQGMNNETNIEIRLVVDGGNVNSTIISSLSSAARKKITLSWTPMAKQNSVIEIYAVPVPDENATANNRLNDTIVISALADIWLNPDGFNISGMAGSSFQDNLTIGNSGLGNLYFNISDGEGVEYPFSESSTSAIPHFNVSNLNIGYRFQAKSSNMYVTNLGRNVPDNEACWVTLWDDTGNNLSQAWVGGGVEWQWAEITPVPLRQYDFYRVTAYCNYSYYYDAYWSGDVNVNTNETVYSFGSKDTFPSNSINGSIFGIPDIGYTVGSGSDWLSATPDNGTVNPGGQTNIAVSVNSSTLGPGFFQTNLSIFSNDPKEQCISAPVNLTLLSAPHDIRVLRIDIPDSGEAGMPIFINATILNQGTSDETNIEVRLAVDGGDVNNTIIPFLLSAAQTQISLSWTPMAKQNSIVKIYVVPVPGETNLTNNRLNDTILISAKADIWLNPNGFNISGTVGSIFQDSLTIGNSGLGDLYFNVSMGSPHPGNYTLSQPVPYWLDGVTGGTKLSLGDDSYTTRTLPFMFDFYNSSFNELHICSNGWASFIMESGSIPGSIVFPTYGWPGTLMVLGDDWNPSNSTGGVYVKQLSSPNRYIVTWYHIPHYDYGGSNDFQMVLYDNGRIDFNYQGLPNASGWEIALNKGDNIYATEYGGLLPEYKTLRFIKESPASNWLSVSPDNGTVNPG